MPTVLLLDVSLSMARPSQIKGTNETVSSSDANEKDQRVTKKALAVHSIYKFLDSLAQHAKLEYVSLVIFSSLYEIVVPFTRDYDQIKTAADSITLYDKTCLIDAITGTQEAIQYMWGNSMPCQVVIISDGHLDICPDIISKISSIEFQFPCDFHMLCLSSAEEFCCTTHPKNLEHLMDTLGGTLSMPEGFTSFNSMDTIIENHVKKMYQLYSGILNCGNLQSNVQLYPPPPSSAVKEDDFSYEEVTFSQQLEIVGFLSQSDIRSPPCISRHLVLALPDKLDDETSGKPDHSKASSFVVLMHGALKVESNVALTQVGDQWFAMLHSWADSKKKSNLVLSVFKPGLDSVPWLGDISKLGNPSTLSHDPYLQVSKLPVPVTDKKSYSNLSPSWLRQATLQSDIQKLLRYGRKLPEKLNVFYKELNRIHKAALSIGFHQLFAPLSEALERECRQLPHTTHPDAPMQLSHAADLLTSKEVLDINYIIQPLDTKFNTGDM